MLLSTPTLYKSFDYMFCLIQYALDTWKSDPCMEINYWIRGMDGHPVSRMHFWQCFSAQVIGNAHNTAIYYLVL